MVRGALLVGAACVGAAVVSALLRNWRDFFHGYLVACLMVVGLSLGCLALGLLTTVVPGRWGDVARPIFIAGSKPLPLVAVLFVPLLLGLHFNYPWARASGWKGTKSSATSTGT